MAITGSENIDVLLTHRLGISAPDCRLLSAPARNVRLCSGGRSQDFAGKIGSEQPKIGRKTVHDSLQLQTENLRLIAHVSRHLLALIDSPAAYHNASGTHVAAGVREFLLAASSDFLVELRNSTAADPWRFGFAVVQPTEHVVIGLCGFAGPPDSDGLVEIAYSISPDYQGKGFATEVATALVDFASSSGRVRTICAHTLPGMNASTRVLEKCGFRKTGEILDSENNLVWRWEKSPRRSTSNT